MLTPIPVRKCARVVLGSLLVMLLWLVPCAAQPHQQDNRGITIDLQGVSIKLYDESHALVIGVSDYTGGWPSLPGVRRDVQAVSEVLRKHNFQVEQLLNPTSQGFNQAMKSFIARHGQAPGNRLLIYFAGHGRTLTTVDGRELGYIVPADAPTPAKGVAMFKQIAISMNEIEVFAQQIESKHALFVFDSCFSGALFEATRGSIPPAIASRTSLPVRQFITAGTAEQEVPDKSIFREQFVEALQGEGDLNGDGYVTGSELGAFLEDKVTNYSNRAQTPRWGKIRNPNLDKGDFVFVMPKTTPPRVATVEPTPPRAAPAAGQVDPLFIEWTYWDTIKNSNNPEDFKAYLKDYPQGRFAALARLRAGMTTPQPTPSPTLALRPLPSPTPAPPRALRSQLTPQTQVAAVSPSPTPALPTARQLGSDPPARNLDAPPTLKATPGGVRHAAPLVDEETRAAQAVVQATSGAARLPAATDFVHRYPQSALRPQVARSVAEQINALPDTAQRVALAENFLATFTVTGEPELVQAGLLRDYITLKRADAAFALAPAALDQLPDPVGAMIDLTTLGIEQVRAQNLKHADDSVRYCARAAELIEANKRPAAVSVAAWADYRKQQLPRLYQRLALFALLSNNTVDANTHISRAIALEPTEPFNYLLLTSIRRNDYEQTGQRYQSTPAGKERDALLTRARALLDQLMDAYAHFIAVSEGNAQYQSLRDQMLHDLSDAYKVRHNNSTQGLQEMIDRYKRMHTPRP